MPHPDGAGSFAPPRHVAILVASLDSGGAERVALNLAKALSATGVRTDLVVVRLRGSLLEDVPDFVRVVDLGARRALTATPHFRTYLKAEAPDAVLAINYEVNITAALAMIGLAAPPRLTLSIHSAPSRYLHVGPPIWRAIMWGASRLLYKRARHVVAVSEGVANDLRTLRWCDPAKIVTIYNPVIGPDTNALLLEAVDHPWIGDKTVPLIVTAGRLTAAKDYPLLLRAFAALLARRPVRLMIVGDGEVREALIRQIGALGIADQVAMVGFQKNPYPYLAAADLFVLSSAWEGFGNVLVEALAAGVPVVSTDCPHGPREILEGGRWGLLVPSGDEQELAKAMERALKLPKQQPDSAGRKRRAQEFSIDAAAQRYLRLL